MSDQAGVVCCLVGEEQFALHGHDVRLVTRADGMRPEAGLNHRVGTIRHRDEVVPVYSLAGLIGRAKRAASDSHVVVTNAGHASLGILVDRAVRSKHVEKRELLPLPALVGPLARRWFDGILRVGDVSCLLLRPSGLLAGATAERRELPPPPAPRPGPTSTRAAVAANMVVLFSSAALPGGREQRYALPAPQVAAIVQALPALQLPGAPAFVKELAWWQGAAVPILDFGERTVASDKCNRHLLARGRDGGWMGFAVDADVTLYRAAADDQLVRQAQRSSAFVAGVFVVGEEQVALLNLDALVAFGEQSPLELCAG